MSFGHGGLTMRILGLVLIMGVLGGCVQTGAQTGAANAAPAAGSAQASSAQTATTEGAAAGQADLIGQGKKLAEMLCVSCHAIGASGESPEPMAPAFRRLGQRYPLNALEEAFAEGILVGHPMMPSYKLSEAQIEALLAYLTSIQERAAG
jgi:mono/diheme cytochrome c family protein